MTVCGNLPFQDVSASTSPNNPCTTEAESKSVDSASARGAFGWATIDNVNIPYLLRDRQYVAVRMVEQKLLSKYPSQYPEELKERAPLVSHHVTEKEATLLNEINFEHCAAEYGSAKFANTDLIVKLADFKDFYSIVKKHFPNQTIKAPSVQQEDVKNLPTIQQRFGWFQVNSTVVPFITRAFVPCVPLSVIRYGACLLTDKPVNGFLPAPEEVQLLNHLCQIWGIDFTFTQNNKLIHLETVRKLSEEKVDISLLPEPAPMGNLYYPGNAQNQPHPKMAQQNLVQPVQPGYPYQQPAANIHQMQMPQYTGQPPMFQKPSLVNQPVALPRNPSVQGMQHFPPVSAVPNAYISPPNVHPVHVPNFNQQFRSQTITPTDLPTYPTPPSSKSPVYQQAESPENPQHCIQQFSFDGRYLSCLVKGPHREPYTLVEAISRVCFKEYSLQNFITCLEKGLNINLLQLTPAEERCFINFYSLPTNSLKCNKILKLADLRDNFVKIKAYLYCNCTVNNNVDRPRSSNNGPDNNNNPTIAPSTSSPGAHKHTLVQNPLPVGPIPDGFATFQKRAHTLLRDVMSGKRRASSDSDGSDSQKIMKLSHVDS